MTESRSPAKRNAVKRQGATPPVAPSPWVEKRKLPAKPKAPFKQGRGKKKTGPDHEYHVFLDGGGDVWRIELDGADTGATAYDQSTAIALAIRDAQHDHAKGLKLIVRVRRADGSSHVEWSSR